MTVINIPYGTRGGFPKPLVVSGYNNSEADYECQAALVRACQVLAARRRMPIPLICNQTTTGGLIFGFLAHRENFARTMRLQGFYKTDLEEGQYELLVALTDPVNDEKKLLLGFTGGLEREFMVDFPVGDGSATAYGQIKGYIQITKVQSLPADATSTLTILGMYLDPEEADSIEV